MRSLYILVLILFIFTPVFSADFAYDTVDTATLVAGGPAKAARVKSMFDDIKDYVNAVSGAWITSSRIIDDTIAGTNMADAIVGDGLEKDGSENFQISLYSTSGLELFSSGLRVYVEDVTLEIDPVTNYLQVVDGGIDSTQLAALAVTEAKIGAVAVTADKLATSSVTTAKILDSTILSEDISDGTIVNADIADATIETAKLSASAQSALLPYGAIVPYAGTSAPTGFLLCDGSAISRATYSDLFTAIGTTWGVGDGTTTFNIPDLEDNLIIGAGLTYSVADEAGVSNGTGAATPYTAVNYLIKY